MKASIYVGAYELTVPGAIVGVDSEVTANALEEPVVFKGRAPVKGISISRGAECVSDSANHYEPRGMGAGKR